MLLPSIFLLDIKEFSDRLLDIGDKTKMTKQLSDFLSKLNGDSFSIRGFDLFEGIEVKFGDETEKVEWLCVSTKSDGEKEVTVFFESGKELDFGSFLAHFLAQETD